MTCRTDGKYHLRYHSSLSLQRTFLTPKELKQQQSEYTGFETETQFFRQRLDDECIFSARKPFRCYCNESSLTCNDLDMIPYLGYSFWPNVHPSHIQTSVPWEQTSRQTNDCSSIAQFHWAVFRRNAGWVKKNYCTWEKLKTLWAQNPNQKNY